jgi:hypothetical protein
MIQCDHDRRLLSFALRFVPLAGLLHFAPAAAQSGSAIVQPAEKTKAAFLARASFRVRCRGCRDIYSKARA